jgi:putative ATPase
MKKIGYGKDYKYAHNFDYVTTDMETLPEKFKGREYYRPGELGLEKEIKKRMEWWEEMKRKTPSSEDAEDKKK